MGFHSQFKRTAISPLNAHSELCEPGWDVCVDDDDDAGAGAGVKMKCEV